MSLVRADIDEETDERAECSSRYPDGQDNRHKERYEDNEYQENDAWPRVAHHACISGA